MNDNTHIFKCIKAVLYNLFPIVCETSNLTGFAKLKIKAQIGLKGI